MYATLPSKGLLKQLTPVQKEKKAEVFKRLAELNSRHPHLKLPLPFYR